MVRHGGFFASGRMHGENEWRSLPSGAGCPSRLSVVTYSLLVIDPLLHGMEQAGLGQVSLGFLLGLLLMLR